MANESNYVKVIAAISNINLFRIALNGFFEL